MSPGHCSGVTALVTLTLLQLRYPGLSSVQPPHQLPDIGLQLTHSVLQVLELSTGGAGGVELRTLVKIPVST